MAGSPPHHLRPPGSSTRCPAAPLAPSLEHPWLPAPRVSLAAPSPQSLAGPLPSPLLPSRYLRAAGTGGSPLPWRLGSAPLPVSSTGDVLTLTHAPAPCLSQLIPPPVLLLLLNISPGCLPCPAPAAAGGRRGTGAAPGTAIAHPSLRLVHGLPTIPRGEGAAGPCCGRGRAASAPSWAGKRGAVVPSCFIAGRVLRVWDCFSSFSALICEQICAGLPKRQWGFAASLVLLSALPCPCSNSALS